MSEADLKAKCRFRVADRYKGRLVHSSPKGQNGYPDSDLLIPNTPIVKIEFKKARDSNVRAAQERWAQWFLDNGIHYWRIYDFDTFVEYCITHVYHNEGYYVPTTPATAGRRPMANG